MHALQLSLFTCLWVAAVLGTRASGDMASLAALLLGPLSDASVWADAAPKESTRVYKEWQGAQK
jgi:hypothetical protein